MASLLVNSIQRFCTDDGPGIRTTVFLQGCSLRCWWCHNPESVPKQNRRAREWPTEALASELERDARYWASSGGGVTLSGGEPLLQPDSAADLYRRLGQRGHHRAIETAGFVPLSHFQTLAPHVDLWLFDLKTVHAGTFRQHTGGELPLVLSNLHWLLNETNTPITLRTPVIHTFNDTPDAQRAIDEYIAGLPRPVAHQRMQGHDAGRARPYTVSAVPQDYNHNP
jgi:pyruvate formate lyase activating enzyme